LGNSNNNSRPGILGNTMDEKKIGEIETLMQHMAMSIKERQPENAEMLRQILEKQAKNATPKEKELIKITLEAIEQYKNNPTNDNYIDAMNAINTCRVLLKGQKGRIAEAEKKENELKEIPRNELKKQLWKILNKMREQADFGNYHELRRLVTTEFEPIEHYLYSKADKSKEADLFDKARNNLIYMFLKNFLGNARRSALTAMAELEEILKKQGII